MGRMFVIGEDVLCCELGTRLVRDVVGWDLVEPAINTKVVTRLASSIPRYLNLVSMHPVLCIADTDRRCAVDLLSNWMPRHTPEDFLFRLAVTESESWLLADSNGIAEYFDIALKHVPSLPDSIDDPKRVMLTLARKSRRRYIRQELVSDSDSSKPGSGYNLHLSDFARRYWNPLAAVDRSPSLNRAVRRLHELAKANEQAAPKF